MYKEERYSFRLLALLMHEMNVQSLISIHFDLCLILRQLVDVRLLFLPVKNILPICSQAFHVSQRGSIVPCSIIELIREFCQFQLGPQSIQLVVGDVKRERRNGCHFDFEESLGSSKFKVNSGTEAKKEEEEEEEKKKKKKKKVWWE